jgi:hypothetical protein
MANMIDYLGMKTGGGRERNFDKATGPTNLVKLLADSKIQFIA